MNNNNNNTPQNGGTPHGKPQITPPTQVNKPSTSEPTQRICKEFVRGNCNKGTQCKHRHELDFETIKNSIKFCRYFQNNRCTRSDCPYLHASSDEERLFLSTGRIPNVLAERYAAMSYPPNGLGAGASINPASSSSGAEYQVQPPLPPQPTTTMPPAPPPPTGYMPTIHNSHSTVTTPLAGTSTTIFPAPLHNGSANNNTYSAPQNNSQISVLPYGFDPSRPPPPRPLQSQNKLKRPGETLEAGPSKMSRGDHCGNCHLQTPRDCEPLRAVLKGLLSAPFMAAVDLIIEKGRPEERGHYYDLVKRLFTDRLIVSLCGEPIEPVLWDDALLDVLHDRVKRVRQFNVCCCGNQENNNSRYEPDAESSLNNDQYNNQTAAFVQAVAQLYGNAMPGPSSAPVVTQSSTTPVYQNYQEVQPQIQAQVQQTIQTPVQPSMPRPFYAYPSSATYAFNAGPSNAPIRVVPPYQNGTRPPAPSVASTSAASSNQQNATYPINPYNSYAYQNHHPDTSYQ